MLHDLDEWERIVGKKLRADFAEELDVFEQALGAITTCVNLLYISRSDLAMKIIAEDYRTLDSESLGFAGCWQLLGEAVTRLHAARLLFLNGYLSRALASTRDALEAAMTADICRNDGVKAKKWISGKQIKLTKGYKYHRTLSWRSWQLAQEILNPLGTHSYMEATVLSSVPQLAILFPNDANYQQMYKHDVRFVIERMIVRCLQLLGYIKDVYPETKALVKDFDDIVAKLVVLAEKASQIPLDELL